MADSALTEIRDLLAEVRDLLRPVADAYQDEYERRESERERQRLAVIRAQFSSDKRRKAWDLIDGTRTQAEIAKQAGMAQGGVSVFLKSLRDLRAISESPKPEKLVDLKP